MWPAYFRSSQKLQFKHTHTQSRLTVITLLFWVTDPLTFTQSVSLSLSLCICVKRQTGHQRDRAKIPCGELDGDDGTMREGESDVLCLPRFPEWFITQTDVCMSAWGSWSVLAYHAPSVTSSLAQHNPVVCWQVKTEKTSLVHVALFRLLFLFVGINNLMTSVKMMLFTSWHDEKYFLQYFIDH